MVCAARDRCASTGPTRDGLARKVIGVSVLVEARDTGRSLLPPEVFDRLVAALMRDKEWDRSLAERVIAQTAAFVKASADNPDLVMAPSRLLDAGWHVFILDTAAYAAFCQRVAGRFVHHRPQDEPAGATVAADARAAIERAGFAVDAELWDGMANCSQCNAGCTDSP